MRVRRRFTAKKLANFSQPGLVPGPGRSRVHPGEGRGLGCPAQQYFGTRHIWESNQASHWPQGFSQTNLTPTANEVFLLSHFGGGKKSTYLFAFLPRVIEKIDTWLA